MNAPAPALMPAGVDTRPLVVHLVYSLGVGGLETLLVDCINRMPAYRHAVVCLTTYTSFADRIRRGDISQRDFDRFVEVSRELSTLPLVIDDTPAITVSALRTRCRRLARTRGLDLVIVDYLQLMRPAAGTRPESRVLEISMITQGLKAIAKELSVPVIALSQLSRAVEQREDKRPQLSDLRESGSIEQDADMVMFVYRDEYYLQQREPKALAFDNDDKLQAAMDKWKADMAQAHNKAELIIGKSRHGPTGTIHLFFEADYTRFGDLDQTHDGGGGY